jgi:Fic/DOC family protein
VELKGLKLTTSAAVKEKRLAALLGGRSAADPDLAAAVVGAEVRGSLELAGRTGTPEEATALTRAFAAVDPRAPFSVSSLFAWQAAITGDRALRQEPRERPEGPPPAPPEFIASRLAITEQWLGADSARELKPAQQGAIALARIVEILPFDRANGMVARLAASHLMVRAGARPPILVGDDAARLGEALTAAYQLQTEPLSHLLEDASERALDVLIAALSPAPGASERG